MKFADRRFTAALGGLAHRSGPAIARKRADAADGLPPQPANIDGTEAGETLTGTSQPDTINGLGGNDILIGLGSADVLNGGEGDDVLRPYAGGGTFDGGNGTDTLSFADLDSSAPGVFLTVDLRETGVQESGGGGAITVLNVENLTGSRANDLLTGNDGANTIGGWSGDDVLRGLGGDDTLLGGLDHEEDSGGNDTLDGGEGDDILDGQIGADTLTGGAGEDLFRHSSSADGHDTITDFESGVDFIEASALSYYLQQEGDDLRIVFTSNSSILLLDTTEAEFSADDIDVDLYWRIQGTDAGETLTGTAYRDHIEGFGGADVLNGGEQDDILDGGDGDDTLRGNAGNDTLMGGEGADRADFSPVSAAITVDLRIHGPQNTGVGMDTLIGIEHVTGSVLADALIGNEQNNTLAGGLGNDVLTGGDGNDTLIGGRDADQLNGGGGLDYVSYATAGGGVIINLTTGVHGGEAGATPSARSNASACRSLPTPSPAAPTRTRSTARPEPTP